MGQLLNAYLESYNRFLGNNYLISQDIEPELVFNNINVEFQSLAKDGQDYMFTTLISCAMAFILMVIVNSTVTVSTDSTAGEKERGTFETLLTFPIRSNEIITGKYLAISFFGIIFGICGLILALPSMSIAKNLFEMFSEISTNYSFTTILIAVVIIIISSLLSAGICMALAGNKKTYKEAQASLQVVTFLTILPMFISMLEIDSNIVSIIPLVNCGVALNNVLINNVDAMSILLMILSTIIYIVLIILYISKQYKKEETLFS